MPVKTRVTADEFLALPETDENRWLQLVEGELVMFSPDMLHNAVQMNLLLALGNWVRAEKGRGRVCVPLDVAIDERNMYEPDISWYSAGRVPGIHEPRPYAMPDLAIEVRSPSTWRYDIGAKKSGYERKGLPELWLVDTPAEEVLVFRRSAPEGSTFDLASQHGRGETLGSPLTAGFALAVDDLFAFD